MARIKLDENLGGAALDLLRQAGHDVRTVAEQGLAGHVDPDIIAVCRRERRCLVTLDLDFGNPLIFRPQDCHGIVVLRLPRRPGHADIVAAVTTLIGGLN